MTYTPDEGARIHRWHRPPFARECRQKHVARAAAEEVLHDRANQTITATKNASARASTNRDRAAFRATTGSAGAARRCRSPQSYAHESSASSAASSKSACYRRDARLRALRVRRGTRALSAYRRRSAARFASLPSTVRRRHAQAGRFESSLAAIKRVGSVTISVGSPNRTSITPSTSARS